LTNLVRLARGGRRQPVASAPPASGVETFHNLYLPFMLRP
jgi:hypothetical protein